MEQKRKNFLLLEQLEERIFLDANPVAAVVDSTDPVDHSIDPVIEPVSVLNTSSGQQEVIPAPEPQDKTDPGGQAETAESVEHQETAVANEQQENNGQEAEHSGTEGGILQGETEENNGISSESSLSTNVQGENHIQEQTGTQDPAMNNGVDQVAVDPMIGEDFTFTVSFDNTTGEDVFGPYVDILLDGGQDGNDAVADDGISFHSATYSSVTVESSVITVTQADVINGLIHPWAKDSSGDPLVIHSVNGQSIREGDQFVSLRLPFGSFTTDQPSIDVEITAHMGRNADVDIDLDVNVSTGALYGKDSLDNPQKPDPAMTDIGTSSFSFKPEVIQYRKDIEVADVGPDCQQSHDPDHDDTRQWADNSARLFEKNHQEIPTGPNYPATYVATIDVADGQTVTGLTLTEHLPDNIVYTGIASVEVGGAAAGYSVSLNGNDLIVTLDNDVTGTGGTDDVVIKYNFYVPEQTTGGAAVIDPVSGNLTHITNNGVVGYNWDPAAGGQGDPNDTAVAGGTVNPEVNREGHFSSNPDVDDISHAQSIALQKDHSPFQAVYAPGDTLNYTLDFQLSDYFSFGDHDSTDTSYTFRIDDVVADGLAMHEDGSGHFTAAIDIWENGNSYSEVLTATGNAGDKMWFTTGTTDDPSDIVIHYNLQKILEGMGLAGGILKGDLVDGVQHGATHGRISYQADIEQQYVTEDADDTDIDQGDIINGGATITGELYDDTNTAFTGQSEEDQSCDSISITTGAVSKDIYSVFHGGSYDYSPGGGTHISPGDTVTYLLRYTMPLSSIEDFELTDYLPLPIFDVDATGWSFNNTVYDGANGAPGVGEWAYTDNDTFHTLTGVPAPTVSVSGAQNSISFDWASYHNQSGAADNSSVIEIVFSVAASDKPFTNGLSLTNQVQATEQGTPLENHTTDAIIQVVLDEPDLTIAKTAVPVSGVDAGDPVTFTVRVDNTGASAAFDTIIKDTLPAGFVQNSTSFTVERDGTALVAGTDFNWVGGGLDGDVATTSDNFFADPGADGIYGTADDGSNGGIELVDVGGTGALGAGQSLVITYTLVASDTVQPGQVMTNTATITNFAGAEGADDHTSEDLSDTATVTTTSPLVTKTVTGTGETSTPGLVNVVVGETVEYSVTITLPEGETHDFHLEDYLDSGLALVSIDSITNPGGDLSSSHGSWDSIRTGYATVMNDGHRFSLNFGDITNSNRDNGSDEQIVVSYTAVVLNVSGNQQNTHLDNQARVSWDNPDNPGTTARTTLVDSPDVIVQEPDLQIVKEVWDPVSGSWVDADDVAGSVHYDQGDTIDYRFTVEHSGSSTEDAFDAVFSDTLPADIDWSNASVTVTSDSAGLNGGTVSLTGNTLSAAWDDILTGETTVFTVTGGQLQTASAGQVITNTGDLTWESVDSDRLPGNPISPYNDNSFERTGDPNDPGGSANDYTDSDVAVINVTGSIDKIDPSPSSYTIGDTVSYTINVTVPDGTTGNLIVKDTLPGGLTYVAGSGQVTDATFDGTLDTTPVITQSGNDLLFAFGDVAATDTGANDNTFTITFDALVTNIAANSSGSSLTNHVSMSFTDPADPSGSPLTVDDPTDPTVNVTEPQITTSKRVEDVDGGVGDTQADNLQDVMRYTVRFTNTGNSTAYEVSALDTLPPGLGNFQLESAIYHNTTAGTDTDISPLTSAVDNGNDTISFTSTDSDSWDVAVGDYIELKYTVEVLGAWFVSGNHTNSIDADWSGRDGSDPDERIYDDTAARNPGLSQDGTQDTATATFTVPRGDANLGDRVWFDADADGLQDGGETGIGGVRVSTSVNVGGVLYSATAITDVNGEYNFTHLQGAPYTVSVDPATLPGGMVQTFDYGWNDPGGDGLNSTAQYTLANNETFTGVDFGYTGIGSIGDYVWYDTNQDGVQNESGMGINGVSVTLRGDLDGDGIYEYSATTTTADDGAGHPGHYIFEHLPFVNYTVTVNSLPNNLTHETYDLDGTTTPDTTVVSEAAIGAVTDFTDGDFGYVGTGSIGNRLWEDTNADGVQDGGETGLGGVTVTLSGVDLNNDGIPDTLTTVTAADGSYSFAGLPPGNYTVTVDSTTLSSDYIQSGDPDGVKDHSSSHVLALNENYGDMDFGYTKTGSIGDTVWFDADGNGVQNGREPGFSGVKVTLVGDIDLDGNPDTLTTYTDADGHYLFNTLPVGNYSITVDTTTLPGGIRQTFDNDGLATADTTAVTLGYDEDNRITDFGYTGTGSIGDQLWIDQNRNGRMDSGEASLPGVELCIGIDLNGDGRPDYRENTVTDGAGRYIFDNLPAGTHTVCVNSSTLPGGSEQVFDPDGRFDNSTIVNLGAGEHNRTTDFGYYQPGGLNGPPSSPGGIATGLLSDPLLFFQASGNQYDSELFFPARPEPLVWPTPVLPVSPVYSGYAEPGTTLSLVLYDSTGNPVGYQTVMADTAGNWLAGFPGTVLFDMPHHMEIIQTRSTYNASSEGFFNMRTYFSPNFTSMVFSSVRLDVEAVFAYMPGNVLESMHRSNLSITDVTWNSSAEYELLSPSTLPAGNSH
ncbi:SdrD B-like domain-containing protein [Desulfomarina sp.]